MEQIPRNGLEKNPISTSTKPISPQEKDPPQAIEEEESVWTRWNKPAWKMGTYERIAVEFRKFVVSGETFPEFKPVFKKFLEAGLTPGDILELQKFDWRDFSAFNDFSKTLKDKSVFQLVKDATDFLGKILALEEMGPTQFNKEIKMAKKKERVEAKRIRGVTGVPLESEMYLLGDID